MLSDEQNRRLTEVGAGPPMGELLRRYWMPIAAVAELDDKATKPVRLLGEDLVLYRDQAGTYGLLHRHQLAHVLCTTHQHNLAELPAYLSKTQSSKPANHARSATSASRPPERPGRSTPF